MNDTDLRYKKDHHDKLLIQRGRSIEIFERYDALKAIRYDAGNVWFADDDAWLRLAIFVRVYEDEEEHGDPEWVRVALDAMQSEMDVLERRRHAAERE